jgi:hypothetical protein
MLEEVLRWLEVVFFSSSYNEVSAKKLEKIGNIRFI